LVTVFSAAFDPKRTFVTANILCFAVSSGIITDEIIQEYIEEEKGEDVVDHSRFQIDPD
jgi:hypothetical protein